MVADVRFSLLKFTSGLKIGLLSHKFLSACNFTDTRKGIGAYEGLGALSCKCKLLTIESLPLSLFPTAVINSFVYCLKYSAAYSRIFRPAACFWAIVPLDTVEYHEASLSILRSDIGVVISPMSFCC